MEALTIIAQVSTASSPFLLVCAIWAFATGKVVPRWLYDASERRADEWKRLVQHQQHMTEQSLGQTERERERDRERLP